ncbi:hypothetical protein PMAYCL1PPCAC_03399 [Pristionchus mayeri]|uniref:mTERF domain-containing protein 1, mitochondrial n=1 Tax=Pristionchus mayeri TaxID=1317129 RepID=A0AAN4Z4K9_9BILA|nr:hypothetical protein PMAYCL1PPCAC_03399 [Pristionchus mayeri]
MLASRLLLRSLRGGVVRAATSLRDASNSPAYFLPPSEREVTGSRRDSQEGVAAADRQSLVLPRDGGAEVDPLEGPSHMPSEEMVAQLRQLYFEEDPETAMEKSTGNTRESGRPAFRPIIYNEDELDGSDLSKPPSRSNPHPFDTSVLPPTHSRTLTPFVNTTPLLKVLVDLGVDLFEIECKYPQVPRHLLRLSHADARTKIRWLVSIGHTTDRVLQYCNTREGESILHDVYGSLSIIDRLQARVNFLASIKFNRNEILKLVTESRFWLNIDVKTTEKRLDTVTGMFGLKKSIMRKVLVKEPRLLMFGLGPLDRIFNLMTKEFGLSPQQVKGILVEDPRVFIMDHRVLQVNFFYATRAMQLQPEQIVQHPFILRVAPHALRSRNEFLRTVGRARFSEDQPVGKGRKGNEVVSLTDLLLASDAEFEEKAARVKPGSYDAYLRSH